jgi:hypothetical protein
MLKALAISVILAATPITAYASQTEEICTNLAKLAGVVAIERDAGRDYRKMRAELESKGLQTNLTEAVMRLTYELAADKSPQTVAGLMYLSCMEALQ